MRSGFKKIGAPSLCLLSIAMAAPALAQSADASAQNRFDTLAQQQGERAGDPAYDYDLAVAAIDAGKYGEAIVALQRVLAVQPNNAPARAELARAYALSGDVDTARQEFGTVVDDPTLPDPVRQRFTGLIRQLDRQIDGGGTEVSSFVEAGGGDDSNINAATDLTQITIPLFAFLGPGNLGAGARAQDDGFYEINSGVSVVSAVGRQDRVFAQFRQFGCGLDIRAGPEVVARAQWLSQRLWRDRAIHAPARGWECDCRLRTMDPAGI